MRVIITFFLILSLANAYPFTFGGFDSAKETRVLQISFDDTRIGVILNSTEAAMHGDSTSSQYMVMLGPASGSSSFTWTKVLKHANGTKISGSLVQFDMSHQSQIFILFDNLIFVSLQKSDGSIYRSGLFQDSGGISLPITCASGCQGLILPNSNLIEIVAHDSSSPGSLTFVQQNNLASNQALTQVADIAGGKVQRVIDANITSNIIVGYSVAGDSRIYCIGANQPNHVMNWAVNIKEADQIQLISLDKNHTLPNELVLNAIYTKTSDPNFIVGQPIPGATSFCLEQALLFSNT